MLFFVFFSTNDIYFLTVPEAGSSKSRCQQVWFLLRLLSLWLVHAPFSCVPTWSFLFTTLKSQCVHSSLSYKDSSQIGLGPTLMDHLNLITSLKIQFPNLAVRTATYEFGGGDTLRHLTLQKNLF